MPRALPGNGARPRLGRFGLSEDDTGPLGLPGSSGPDVRDRHLMTKAVASTHRTEPWTCNSAPKRSMEDAIKIAERFGVKVPEWIEFNVCRGAVPRRAHASYAIGDRSEGALVPWNEFLNSREKVPVHIRRYVLRSDEAIVAVIGHETHEVTALRDLFRQNGDSMRASRLRELISPEVPRNLHWDAVDYADDLVRSMREE